MALDDYDPSTALTAYYPTRDERRPARLWATEKLLHDMAELGMVEFFEGPGTNPTTIADYATTKLWLRVSSGVTAQPGEIRAYDGSGDPALLASWPVLTPATYLAFFGASVPGASIVTAASYEAIQALLSGVFEVADYTALKALTINTQPVIVTDPNRGGTFVWRTGDYSAEVTADSAEGIYVPSTSDPDGDTGCWVRQGDWAVAGVDPRWFGALADGVADDTAAVQAAIDYAASLVEEDGSFYKAPVTLVFPPGVYKVKELNVVLKNVNIRGHGAVLQLADPTTYIMAYNPWDGGFQQWFIEGLTFDGGVLQYLTDTYGDVTIDYTNQKRLNIHTNKENVGLIIGSNNVTVRNCLFTRCGAGILYLTQPKSWMGLSGNMYAYSGSVNGCGFRQSLYGVVGYSPNSYVGNIEISDCYCSAVYRGCFVFGGSEQSVAQKLKFRNITADTRGYPFVLINATSCLDDNCRFEANSVVGALDTLDISDAIPHDATLCPTEAVPYYQNGERVTHLLHCTDLEVRNPYAGFRARLTGGSVLRGQSQTQGTLSAVIDAGSLVLGETVTTDGVQGMRTRIAYESDTATSVSLPVRRMLAIKANLPTSIRRANVELVSLVDRPVIGRKNYFYGNPYISTYPFFTGTTPTATLADDGIIVDKCLEITGHGSSGFSLPGMPSPAALTALDATGYVVVLLAAKRLSATPFSLTGPYGLQCFMSRKDEWMQFALVRDVLNGLSASASFTAPAGSHDYRLCNFAVTVFATLQEVYDFLDSNRFPVGLHNLTSGAAMSWPTDNSVKGDLTWSAAVTRRYVLPGTAGGATGASRPMMTANEYVKGIWLKATGADIEAVKVGSGNDDDFYAASVSLADGEWKKVVSDVMPDTSGTDVQNYSFSVQPLAEATMDIEYKVEFGKL